MSKKIIKLLINLSAAVLIGSAVLTMRKQITVAKAQKIRQQQRRYGSDFQLSEEKKKILEQADQYLQNHLGRKFGSMMRTQQFYTHQIQKKLRQKQQKLSTLTQDQKQEMDKLKDQINQLHAVYSAVKPKRITSWQQLRQPEQVQQGY